MPPRTNDNFLYIYFMTLPELRRAVSGGEGLRVEFKRKLPEWEKLIREVVAFANTQGGTVFIGVDDNGEIFGVKDPREIEEAIDIKLDQYAWPPVPVRIETVPITRKRSVVCIHVRKSDQKPHRALTQPGEKRGLALIRIEDESCTASLEVFELLKYEGRERNTRVEFGDKEKVLMEYLEKNSYITLRIFKEIAKLPKQIASRTLVHLVKANVLKIQPRVDEDRFYAGF